MIRKNYNQIIRCLTNTVFRESFLKEDHNENGSGSPEQHPSACEAKTVQNHPRSQ